LIEENKKLKALLNEDSAGPSSGNAKYLKNKVRITNLFILFIDIPLRKDISIVRKGKI